MVDAAAVQNLLNGMGAVANNVSDMRSEIRELVHTVKERSSQPKVQLQQSPDILDVEEDADVSSSDNEEGRPNQGSRWRQPRKRTSNKFHVCFHFHKLSWD